MRDSDARPAPVPVAAHKVALVTGASRGVGAATARLLARRGLDVVVNYRDKARRAEQVAAAVRALGRRALSVQADLTQPDPTARMFALTGDLFGALDVLVLNASGGLERDAPAGYAMRLNRDAQVRAVDLAVPLMPAGGRVVFVTSHAAHFYGRPADLGDYEPVARGKHAGEQALRARLPKLARRAVSLIVVSGDLIEGTITATLLDRASPGLLRARREQVGELPTVEGFAAAIAAAATDPALASGTTILVGSTEQEQPG